ncbi:hypothetical protein ACFL1Q_00390 [Patescibacteria group bacterium]
MSPELDSNETDIQKKIEGLYEILRNSVVSTDIDGVEVDLAKSVINKLNERLGSNHKVSELTNYWSLADMLTKDHPQIVDPVDYTLDIWTDPEVVLHAPPQAGVLRFSKRWFDKGLKVHRITSRPSSKGKVTFEWYKNRMPWVDKSLIHIQQNEDRINADFKISEIKKIGSNIHFEDSLEHAERIVDETDCDVVMVPQPWNVDCKEKNRIIVVPVGYYKALPKIYRVWFHLAETIVV